MKRIAIIGLATLLLVGCGQSGDKVTMTVSEYEALKEAAENNAETATPELTNKPTQMPTIAPEKKSNETVSQQNAVKQAKNYIENMAFSHDGLIDQLVFEGFSNEDATYGADNCGADWMEQAVKAAKNYLDNMAFSKEGLIEQLVFEKFTQEEAEHGANTVFGEDAEPNPEAGATPEPDETDKSIKEGELIGEWAGVYYKKSRDDDGNEVVSEEPTDLFLAINTDGTWTVMADGDKTEGKWEPASDSGRMLTLVIVFEDGEEKDSGWSFGKLANGYKLSFNSWYHYEIEMTKL